MTCTHNWVLEREIEGKEACNCKIPAYDKFNKYKCSFCNLTGVRPVGKDDYPIL